MTLMHSRDSFEDVECTIGNVRTRVNVTIHTCEDMTADALYSLQSLVMRIHG